MSDLSISSPPKLSGAEPGLFADLLAYRERFTAAVDGYGGDTAGAAELETLMAQYSSLITDERNAQPFARLQQILPAELRLVTDDLRAQSARGASVMEKYRALELLAGTRRSVGYFANVESCIDSEYGAVRPNPQSRFLLIGSGAFPMTLINVGRQTGAPTVGVDIDPEALALAQRVIEVLGSDLDIRLEGAPAEELAWTKRATHIVISSTVAVKYQILDRLHGVTRDDVVVAMRFGDGLKSLFNYPSETVDSSRWRLLETISRPGQVFDIALYAKDSTSGRGGSS